MTYSVIVRGLAEQDLAEVELWYDQERAGLGSEFRDEVDRLMNRLAETPLIYQRVHRNVRRARLRRFPYHIYFAVEAATVTVLGCIHGRRGPRAHRSVVRRG